MSYELRKAAERVRDLFPPEGHEGRHSVDLENMPVECIADLMLLAGAYLASVQPDDAEPVTCQRLVDAGFTERLCGGFRNFDCGDVTLSQRIEGGTPVEWFLLLRGYEARMSSVPKTMGAVRRLIAALKGE